MAKRTSYQKQPGERRIDETVTDSFPASDPPAQSGITGVRRHHEHPAQPDNHARTPSHERGDEARPTGQPTSDRHSTETSHSWEDEA